MSNEDQVLEVTEKSESEIDDELGNLFDESESEEEEAPKAKAKAADPGLAFKKIPVTLTLEVDSVQVLLSDIMDLSTGDVLPMNKKIDEPLDVRVNGSLIGKAEIVIVDGNYGLRLIEVIEESEETEGKL